ncbi:hypothetical protein [Bacillus salipaludis]|uniref:Uncharacterized protein n=1 Tax=Bacillus salipaludis TaxID=2547811 RepID=A0AA90QND4_9BACI|nr:hypothetical protein [Bacillus salipaludis]MDQ6596665.1 hypothetical protein [Bacillus salipaludis]
MNPAEEVVTVPSAIMIGLQSAPVSYYGMNFIKGKFKLWKYPMI